MADSNLQKQRCLTKAFLYADSGEGVVDLLRQDDTCRHVFSAEIVEKVQAKKEDFASVAAYKKHMVTPVMEAFLDRACPPAKPRPQITQWFVRQYLPHRHNGKPIQAEDLYKIDDNLKYFDSLKNSSAFK